MDFKRIKIAISAILSPTSRKIYGKAIALKHLQRTALTKRAKKKGAEKKFAHLLCPPQTPLLSTSHDRAWLPRFHYGSPCPWIPNKLEGCPQEI